MDATRNHKASDGELLTAYAELRNVWKVADRFGMCGQSVHERLVKLNAIVPKNLFTDAERDRLVREYAIYRANGQVARLAADMGRTVPFLSRQARALGLTDGNRHAKLYASTWKYMTEDAARVVMDAFKTSPLGVGQFCAKNGYDDEGFTKTLRKFWPDEYEHVVESKAPLSTKYRLGRQVEYRVRDYMKAQGYVAMRSPASKSPIDIIAIKPGQVLFIQCKRGGSLPPKEWNAIFDLAQEAGAIAVMAETPYPRCLRFWRLLARKDGSKRRQPMEPFVIDEVTGS